MNRRYADNAFLVLASKKIEINTGISGLRRWEEKNTGLREKKANVCSKKKTTLGSGQFENVF